MKPKKAFIPFIKLILTKPGGILKALLRHTKEAYRKHQFEGNTIKTVDLLDVIESLDEEIKSYTYLDGTSRTMDIAFLKAVCKTYEMCNYLEIGSWRGESLLNVASVAHQCTSISLSKEEMIEFGMDQKDADALNLLSNEIPNVRHIAANSHTFDFGELGDKFDVIFIDGDHSYEGVKLDTSNAFRLLKDEHSVIIWHDCGFGMQDLRYESIQAIYDACSKEQFEQVYRVSNTMCAIYTTRKLKDDSDGFETIPNKLFNVSIKSVPLNS